MKKIGWILTSLGIVLAGGLYYGYEQFINVKPQAITIPQEERFFQDDGTSLDWLEDPALVENTDTVPKNQPVVESPSDVVVTENTVKEQTSSPKRAPKQNIDSGQPSATPVKKANPIAEIKSKYTVQFKKLERTYQGKLMGLIGQAKADYVAMKKGELETSTMSLATEYLKRAQQMESEADAQFYSVLSQMKQELINQGLPNKLADNAEIEYEQRKKNQRAALLQKFSSKL
ncbi:hypothetical protein [Ammoniphilus resinae]|uniref:Uncharacterized protein n=1 Tax=Ammoniphilus resinae TaxID=861532 RepID=A0ABS4GLH3_9BACL|nr:hypothetical protein [Ammoniphilus resinae]MBP1930987.1 hypothetical protein [Ammoniphilus resinae]